MQNSHFDNQSINVFRDNIPSPYMIKLFDYDSNNARPLTEEDIQRLAPNEFLDEDVFRIAYKGYLKYLAQGKIKKKILSVIDYGLNVNTKRLFIFDIENNKVLFQTWVAHAILSDQDKDGIPEDFSNTPNSKKSSKGFMRTQSSEYYGLFGLSLRLEGLETINSNVLKRAIVFHGDGTLTARGSTWGYNLRGSTEGCFGLPVYESGKFYGLEDRPLSHLITETIKGYSLLYVHSEK